MQNFRMCVCRGGRGGKNMEMMNSHMQDIYVNTEFGKILGKILHSGLDEECIKQKTLYKSLNMAIQKL